MKEDYLWDKTGEADPEIEELERKLSSLRYKRPAEPLPLPVNSRLVFRRGFSTPLAIAAALVILVLAGGLWFALHRTDEDRMSAVVISQAPKTSQIPQVTSGPGHPPGPIDTSGGNVAKKVDEGTMPPPAPLPRINRTSGSQRLVQARAQTVNQPSRAAEKARGEEAKAKLIMALQIASDKLNTVQKKIQGPIS